MKGTIPKCLGEMVRAQHGPDRWTLICTEAGLARWHHFVTTEDVPDELVVGLFHMTSAVLGKSLQQVMDDFGMHWSTVYAPDIYGQYFRRASNAREMLLSMSEVHRVTTDRVAEAVPPRFEYESLEDGTLLMRYHSERGLSALMPGLIRGVGAYYGERVEVEKDGDVMRIRFLGSMADAAS